MVATRWQERIELTNAGSDTRRLNSTTRRDGRGGIIFVCLEAAASSEWGEWGQFQFQKRLHLRVYLFYFILFFWERILRKMLPRAERAI